MLCQSLGTVNEHHSNKAAHAFAAPLLSGPSFFIEILLLPFAAGVRVFVAEVSFLFDSVPRLLQLLHQSFPRPGQVRDKLPMAAATPVVRLSRRSLQIAWNSGKVEVI